MSGVQRDVRHERDAMTPELSIDALLEDVAERAARKAIAETAPATAQLTPDDDGVFTVQQLGEYLQIGKSAVYALVHSAEFLTIVKVTRVGNRTLIPRWHVRRWLDQGGHVTPEPMPETARLKLTAPAPKGVRQRHAR
ncbi:helix-turn-helix domain-containing protein [Deinococcus peraridilitoris]|uniref:Helix-turn-helix domain-containing protein n=1 Tax=Deinococcus peraridilitoris (strain DSM 19664 / LMG 22246 / CIP 109416 / KR-200) TaxID=937777 RepID=K9ZZS8_DEIPD|nr:helix-turn-helix domain-containing protein [Deinococcus peraridilitoris]AFZ67123.1 hypothetical protein Deipe_1582 [Deinococcus peraridilitoris DSM 19664]